MPHNIWSCHPANSYVTSTGAVEETGTTSINLFHDITTSGADLTLNGNVVIAGALTMSTSGGDVSSPNNHATWPDAAYLSLLVPAMSHYLVRLDPILLSMMLPCLDIT